MTDPYAVLGVSSTASNAEIKAAYRQLVSSTIPMPVERSADAGP